MRILALYFPTDVLSAQETMPTDAPYRYRMEKAATRRFELFRNGRHVIDTGGMKIAVIDNALNDLVDRCKVSAGTEEVVVPGEAAVRRLGTIDRVKVRLEDNEYLDKVLARRYVVVTDVHVF